jgi:hypothetical protein
MDSRRQAHAHLLAICRSLDERLQKQFGYAGELTIVTYVGTGCGAGWAATYAGA